MGAFLFGASSAYADESITKGQWTLSTSYQNGSVFSCDLENTINDNANIVFFASKTFDLVHSFLNVDVRSDLLDKAKPKVAEFSKDDHVEFRYKNGSDMNNLPKYELEYPTRERIYHVVSDWDGMLKAPFIMNDTKTIDMDMKGFQDIKPDMLKCISQIQ